MATELMRLIDYWIGVPLCFLLAGVNRIFSIFSFPRKGNIPPKILLIKLSELGAIILSYSLVRRLKNDYPKSEIFFLVFRKSKPLIEALNIIAPENILTISDNSPLGLILDTFKVLVRMRKERFDIVLDLELFSRFTAILTYLSGAQKRIGFYRYHFEGLYRGNLLTHNVQYNPLLHTSKTLVSLAQVLTAQKKTTPELKERVDDSDIILPRFEAGQETVEQMWQRLSSLGLEKGMRIYLVNAGDGIVPLREWPQENYTSLIREILDHDSKNCLLFIGLGGSSKKAQAICAEINDKRCMDLTNKTTFLELMSLFQLGTALIANDCGLVHIASMAQIKKFIIFGPESPVLYTPLGANTWIFYSGLPCSPCLSTFNHRMTACKDNWCLKLIPTDEVFSLVKANTL